MAYLVLIFAALSRLVPHMMHGIGLNFTAVGGGLLFFGARRSRWQTLIAVAVMALTDVYLTRFVYDYPFHVGDYIVTWAWYGLVSLLGYAILRRIDLPRAALAVLGSAGSFFLLSNFAVWVEGGLYSRTAAGLVACYGAAVPFFADDVVSTGLTVAVLFGLPVAAAQLLRMWREGNAGQPIA